MEIKIEEKDYEEIREKAMQILAEKVANKIWEPYDCGDFNGDWDKREQANRKARNKILDAVDWKNAPKAISETVVKNFFQKLVD